jgi:hypothetical protein
VHNTVDDSVFLASDGDKTVEEERDKERVRERDAVFCEDDVTLPDRIADGVVVNDMSTVSDLVSDVERESVIFSL